MNARGRQKSCCVLRLRRGNPEVKQCRLCADPISVLGYVCFLFRDSRLWATNETGSMYSDRFNKRFSKLRVMWTLPFCWCMVMSLGIWCCLIPDESERLLLPVETKMRKNKNFVCASQFSKGGKANVSAPSPFYKGRLVLCWPGHVLRFACGFKPKW